MAKKKAAKLKSAAIVTIHRASEMTPEGRREVAAWLRAHAQDLVKYGDQYSRRFTGRYTYR